MFKNIKIEFCISNVFNKPFKKIIQSYPSFTVKEYGWAYFSFVVRKNLK